MEEAFWQILGHSSKDKLLWKFGYFNICYQFLPKANAK